MPPKSVAAGADVSATAGTVPYTGAQSGNWTAGKISPTPHPHLVVDGSPAISAATCTFSFTGSTSGGSPVSGTDIVTLNATATMLQCDQVSVLVDGDQVVSTQYKNTLKVSSTRTLQTS